MWSGGDAFPTAVFDSMCGPSNVWAYQLPTARRLLAMGAWTFGWTAHDVTMLAVDFTLQLLP
jgi:hypothetical protein